MPSWERGRPGVPAGTRSPGTPAKRSRLFSCAAPSRPGVRVASGWWPLDSSVLGGAQRWGLPGWVASAPWSSSALALVSAGIRLKNARAPPAKSGMAISRCAGQARGGFGAISNSSTKDRQSLALVLIGKWCEIALLHSTATDILIYLPDPWLATAFSALGSAWAATPHCVGRGELPVYSLGALRAPAGSPGPFPKATVAVPGLERGLQAAWAPTCLALWPGKLPADACKHTVNWEG